MTYSGLYERGVSALKDSGIADAGTDARLLFEFILNIDRYDIFAHPDREVSDEDEKRYIEAVGKRCERIPLQHITGVQDFMGSEFKVNGDVLVPRQDTEILVESAMKHVHDGMSILDLCTGSGCVLLSLLTYSNGCLGVGTDISEKALSVASENAIRLKEKYNDSNVMFFCGDLYDALSGKPVFTGKAENGPDECPWTEKDGETKYDIIVSNPPYIRTDVIEGLEPEVKDHDPYIALDGGEDGLVFYRRITAGLKGHLKKGGTVFVEIGYDQGEAVKEIFEEAGLTDVEIIKDYSGNDRVVTGSLSLL